ncbi:hypothetical protein LJR164_003457 [Phenylobacterium sp. LjRoot164]|uniref:Rap1a/Tai family immunity protein n=1 Tax=unclassified Phenylobacterium TaxID=2640670 RepID=UPI003ECD912D
MPFLLSLLIGAKVLMPIGVLAAASPAAPQEYRGFVDAAEIVAMCSADEQADPETRSFCLGYVSGAADQMLAQQDDRRRTMCLPDDLLADDLADTVRDYGDVVAASHDLSGADFLESVFASAYPCQVVELIPSGSNGAAAGLRHGARLGVSGLRAPVREQGEAGRQGSQVQ